MVGSLLEHLRDQHGKMITEFASTIATLLRRRLGEIPNLTVVDILVSDPVVMNEATAQYHLRPLDALRYATMQRIGCLDFAGSHPHFDRVPTIKRHML